MTLDALLTRAAILSASSDATGLAPLRAALFRRLHGSGWAPSGAARGSAPGALTSDEALLSAFLQGEASAFDALFDRWAGKLQAYAQRSLHRDAAADAVQDSFIVLFEKASTLLDAGAANVGGFLFGTLRHKVLHAVAAHRREMPAADSMDDEPAGDDDALADLLRKQERERLARLMDSACDPLEQAVLTQDLDDQDGPGIARTLGISAGYVRVLRHRALRKLRDALAKEAP